MICGSLSPICKVYEPSVSIAIEPFSRKVIFTLLIVTAYGSRGSGEFGDDFQQRLLE